MKTFIEIDGWKTNIGFSAAHILPNMGKCSRLHGHSYTISSKIIGEKNQNDVVVDFSVLKTKLKKIAEELDHRILIAQKSKYITIGKKEVTLSFNEKTYIFPLEDCVLIPCASVTAENLAEFILHKVINSMEFPSTITQISIGVSEGFGNLAWCKKAIN